jgi:hypothetical protein
MFIEKTLAHFFSNGYWKGDSWVERRSITGRLISSGMERTCYSGPFRPERICSVWRFPNTTSGGFVSSDDFPVSGNARMTVTGVS